MKDEDKILIVNELLELAKQSKLNKSQKNKILKIIENLDATEIQKERFIIYYGFNDNNIKFGNLTKIAKLYGCTMSTVRASVISVRIKLIRLNEECEIIKEIVNECKKDMYEI
ncbi:MAG TPA: hypothetical protein OIM60_07100 [Clostridiaceae bacterium]|nr:hypothetical protein [Clostridiaceae bacterium]